MPASARDSPASGAASLIVPAASCSVRSRCSNLCPSIPAAPSTMTRMIRSFIVTLSNRLCPGEARCPPSSGRLDGRRRAAQHLGHVDQDHDHPAAADKARARLRRRHGLRLRLRAVRLADRQLGHAARLLGRDDARAVARLPLGGRQDRGGILVRRVAQRHRFRGGGQRDHPVRGRPGLHRPDAMGGSGGLERSGRRLSQLAGPARAHRRHARADRARPHPDLAAGVRGAPARHPALGRDGRRVACSRADHGRRHRRLLDPAQHRPGDRGSDRRRRRHRPGAVRSKDGARRADLARAVATLPCRHRCG